MTWNSVGDGRLSSTKMAYSPAATTDSLPFSVEGLILGASTPLAEVIESSDDGFGDDGLPSSRSQLA